MPKPVLPLANRPFISYMLDWLYGHGYEDIVMSCGFLSAQVRSVLGEGDGRMRIRYVDEQSPLGTAGAVKHAEPLLGERFAVLNGDVLTDFDLSALRDFHRDHGAVATIALIPVDDPSAYGLVRTDGDGAIEAFLEKPKSEEIDTDQINAGAYVLEREVLDRIEPGRMTSFEREVFPSLIGNGLFGYRASGYWLDIGTPERYLEATRDILEGRVATAVGALLADTGMSIGSGTTVANDAQLSAPVLIGDRCEIESGAVVGPDSVLGEGSTVAAGARIERAVLLEGATVGSGATVTDSVVGPDARVGADSHLEGGVVIGAGATVEDSARLCDGERVEARSLASETS